MTSFFQDVRYALRQLRRSPGFAFTTVLTLGLSVGLLSYQVSSRTRELGVRMALGAQRSQILTLVLTSGLILTAAGLLIGIFGSFAIRQAISALLTSTVGTGPGVSASLLGHQTSAVAIAAAAMLFATVFASLLPAHRASQVEPIDALRSE